VLALDPLDVGGERFDELGWENGHSVFSPLPIPYGQRPALEIHILDPQAYALHHPKAGAVEEGGHEPWRTTHSGEKGFDFVAR
jgi:hypothetical protein